MNFFSKQPKKHIRVLHISYTSHLSFIITKEKIYLAMKLDIVSCSTCYGIIEGIRDYSHDIEHTILTAQLNVDRLKSLLKDKKYKNENIKRILIVDDISFKLFMKRQDKNLFHIIVR